MEGINYGELFGVDIGVNEQEVAAPVEVETDNTQGVNEQEVAKTAEEEHTADTAGTNNGDTETAAENEEGQSEDKNAAFAAARRKAEAERDAAIAKAKEDAKAYAEKYLNEAFKNSGLTNPYTKKPIASKAEFEEYRKQYEEQRKSRILKQTGMTEEQYAEYVDSLPEIRQARIAAAEAQEAQKAAKEAQAKVQMDEQIKELSKIDPSIKGLADLTKMADYDKFYDLVRRGNTLVDAYKLLNYDRLVSGAAAASKQAAINAVNSKEHMRTTSSRGTGAVTVPSDVREMYRMFNPDATDAEIQAHYNKSLKK